MNRVIPGLLLAICWLILLLKGSIPLFAGVLFIGLTIGAYEYGEMLFSNQCTTVPIIFAFLCSLPLLTVFFFPTFGVGAGLALAFLLLSWWIIVSYNQESDIFGFFCKCSAGLVWVGFLGAHLLLIRSLPEGNAWLLILTGITAGSDSGAYYAGRAFGKNKLSPLISPNKTIEGAIGGVVSGMLIAIILSAIFLQYVPWIFVLVSAFVLCWVGICGDLLESVVKRATGTKDSGTILGGHGGVLDRADSILFAAPVLYYLLIASSGLP